MKKILMAMMLVMAFSVTIAAHDEGHGPKLADVAKYGGAVAPAILAKESSLGRKAKLIYKGELTRSTDGTVRVYLYDTRMKPLMLSGFETTGKATLEVKKNSKWEKSVFALQKEGDSFVGKMPKVARKPFNIDVIVREGSRDLLIAFDGLD